MRTCSELLTSQGPRVRFEIAVTSSYDGWELRFRHAHVGGLIVDCPAEVYSHLATDELADVLSVLVDSITATQQAASDRFWARRSDGT